jgi:hypothetical protein
VGHPSLRSPRVSTFGQDKSAAGSVGYDASVGERAPTKDLAWESVKGVEKMPPAPRLKDTWHLPSHQQVAPKPWTLSLNPRPETRNPKSLASARGAAECACQV